MPESGQIVSLFFIRTDGTIACWPGTIRDQLTKAGLGSDLVNMYEQELSQTLRNRTKRLEINYPANEVSFDEFTNTVDRFITNVLNAAAID